MEVKRTERGWAGHFIGSERCTFRRNTLLECGDRKWVVSTVGCYIPDMQGKHKVETIGAFGRYFETMAFEAEEMNGYIDADVTKGIGFESEWCMSCDDDGTYEFTWDKFLEKYPHPDNAANDMHEAVVEELTLKIQKVDGQNI